MSKVNEKVRQYDLSREELDEQLQDVMGEVSQESLEKVYNESIGNFEVGAILKGTVAEVRGDDVIIDVGYKSEGRIYISEFDNSEEIQEGNEVEVLLEQVEDETGLIVLSKRKADRIRGWERIIEKYQEDDVVRGTVMRKIKGGLLVDIGVPVFLPASQINIRKPGDISEYIGQEIQCKILKIDTIRRNIVVSRRKIIEERREEQKKKLMQEIAVGQIRKGVVKNIADFGAFVDLGGIDGLLHITDMSWGRVGHPLEVVSLDDEIEVKIIDIDWQRERIALGLKQKTESPWLNVKEKYPIGSKVKGQVVNIMNYGAFVRLEDGIEGLVHISEMSWTRRINHPSEVVAIGDIVEVVILDINEDKQEISLGMKQVEENPWKVVAEKYPSGTVIEGTVHHLTNYGAFVEIEEGIDGLLHLSDMSWTKKINHPSEVLKKGDVIHAVILNVDQEKKRIALGMKQLTEDPWEYKIPSKYVVGDVVNGTVTKITNFGVFVELEEDLEGLLHISELSNRRIENPEDIVKVGDKIEVKVLKVEPEERKIALGLVRIEGQEDEEAGPSAETGETQQAPQTEESVQAAEASETTQQASETTQQASETSEPAETTADVPQAEEAVGEIQSSKAENVAEEKPAAEAQENVAADEQESLPRTSQESEVPESVEDDSANIEEDVQSGQDDKNKTETAE